MRQNVLHSWFTGVRLIIHRLHVGAAFLLVFAGSIASSAVDAQVRNNDQQPAIAGAPSLGGNPRPGLGGAAQTQDNVRPGYRPGAFGRENERRCDGFRSDDRRPGSARQGCR